MIPFPEVFAYQEPVDGQVLVATFGGDLRVPGMLVRQPGGRSAVIVGIPDLLADGGVVASVPPTEEILDEARLAPAAAELAIGGLFESTGALDGHGESVDELFDPFAGSACFRRIARTSESGQVERGVTAGRSVSTLRQRGLRPVTASLPSLSLTGDQ